MRGHPGQKPLYRRQQHHGERGLSLRGQDSEHAARTQSRLRNCVGVRAHCCAVRAKGVTAELAGGRGCVRAREAVEFISKSCGRSRDATGGGLSIHIVHTRAQPRTQEADVRLFMTLIRFDDVYVVYFKTNRGFIHEFPNLRDYVRDVYQTEGESAFRFLVNAP